MAGSNDASPTRPDAPGGAATADGRGSRGERTRAKLLEAGVTVFAARGYHAARVDDIVARARTSHGTFYLYFSNKEALFGALTVEAADEMTALARRLPELRPTTKSADRLTAWLAEFSALYRRCGPIIRAWTEAEIGGSEVGRLGTDTLAEITRNLVRRIRDAAPPGIDARVAALALVAMIERLNYYVLTNKVALTDAAMVETLATVMHRSLFGTS